MPVIFDYNETLVARPSAARERAWPEDIEPPDAVIQALTQLWADVAEAA